MSKNMQLTVQYIMKAEEVKAFNEAITLAKHFEEVKDKCNNCIYYNPKFKLCYGCIGSLYLIGDAERLHDIVNKHGYFE